MTHRRNISSFKYGNFKLFFLSKYGDFGAFFSPKKNPLYPLAIYPFVLVLEV
jgi:hypothetical protein